MREFKEVSIELIDESANIRRSFSEEKLRLPHRARLHVRRVASPLLVDHSISFSQSDSNPRGFSTPTHTKTYPLAERDSAFHFMHLIVHFIVDTVNRPD
jgi:hypothetical protein